MKGQHQITEKEADEYFEHFFEEKENIQEFNYIRTEENHIFEFNYTPKDMLKLLKSFNTDIKAKIRDTLVKIDFHNGDVNHFLNYVFKGYADMQVNNMEE